MRKFISTMASIAVLSGAAMASTTTIDFDTLSAGNIVTDQYAALGITISADSNGANDHAIVFDTTTLIMGEDDDDLLSPFTNISTGELLTPGNVLIISDDDERITCNATDCTPADDEGQGGTIFLDFDGFLTAFNFNYFDTETSDLLNVEFFDGSGSLLMDALLIGTGGDNTFANSGEFVLGAGIRRVALTFTGSGALDDLTFDTVPTPLPGAAYFMGTALLGGFLTRRRKAKAQS